jgi:hypothetical protein
MFKKVPAGLELEISQFLSSPGLMQEPHNHCVQLLEILELPDVPEQKLIVMPFLRPFDNPRFQTFGEFVSFFDQICDVRLEHNGGIGIPDNPLPRVSCSLKGPGRGRASLRGARSRSRTEPKYIGDVSS